MLIQGSTWRVLTGTTCPRRMATSTGSMGKLRRMWREPLLHQDGQRRPPMPPPNLLALLARTRLVLHGQLLDPHTAPEQSARNLRLDVERVCSELERTRQIGRHDLVAGLHVCERRTE